MTSTKTVVKGLTAGLIGGLAASWVMNRFQAMLSKAIEGQEKPHGAQSIQEGSPKRGAGAELQKPLAIAVIGGLSLSTIFTLVFMPVVFRGLSGKGTD